MNQCRMVKRLGHPERSRRVTQRLSEAHKDCHGERSRTMSFRFLILNK